MLESGYATLNGHWNDLWSTKRDEKETEDSDGVEAFRIISL